MNTCIQVAYFNGMSTGRTFGTVRKGCALGYFRFFTKIITNRKIIHWITNQMTIHDQFTNNSAHSREL